jgi:hypothetical protein
MEGEGQDVAVETGSSTGTDSAADSSQATTQPAGQPKEQYVPLARMQEYVRQVQEARPIIARVPQLEAQLKEASDRIAAYEKKAAQGATTPEDDYQMSMAQQALERLLMRDEKMLERVLMNHPKMAALLKNADQLVAGQGGLQQIQQAQGQALLRSAQSHIHGLAKEAGLPQEPGYLQRLVRLVAAEAQQLEGGNQRFSQGDLSVLDEAFQALQGNFLAHTKRAGTAALIATKNATSQLPPAPRGGAAGPPGLPKFDPAKTSVRDRLQQLSRAAGDMLAESRQE